MSYRKNLLVTSSLLSFVILGAATMPEEAQQQQAVAYTNLKILPKNIGKEELDVVMKGFTNALGVRCNYCHAPQADNPARNDFASDAKPEKATAREMMKMAAKINKTFFNKKAGAVMDVTCKTCHNGKAHPEK
jgi:hypothetical protein